MYTPPPTTHLHNTYAQLHYPDLSVGCCVPEDALHCEVFLIMKIKTAVTIIAAAASAATAEAGPITAMAAYGVCQTG